MSATETLEAPASQGAPASHADASADASAQSGKFLTFFLGEEEYGIEILKVREIIGMKPITFVPGTPPYIEGVLNLRGQVIPVVNLRLKFEMEAVEETEETCIIVVQSAGVRTGVLVDRVSEVLEIADEDLVDAPSLGWDVDTTHLLGIGKAKDSVKQLLDIDRVLADVDDLEVGASQARESAPGS